MIKWISHGFLRLRANKSTSAPQGTEARTRRNLAVCPLVSSGTVKSLPLDKFHERATPRSTSDPTDLGTTTSSSSFHEMPPIPRSTPELPDKFWHYP
jgi:hypothetical protein